MLKTSGATRMSDIRHSSRSAAAAGTALCLVLMFSSVESFASNQRRKASRLALNVQSAEGHMQAMQNSRARHGQRSWASPAGNIPSLESQQGWGAGTIRNRGSSMARYSPNRRNTFFSDGQNRWYDGLSYSNVPNHKLGDTWGRRNNQGLLQGEGSRAFYPTGRSDSTYVTLESGGRPYTPVEANVEYWQGPNNTPQSVRTWSMDGALRPFQGEFATSGRNRYNGMYSNPGTVQIRNTGPMTFPAYTTVNPGPSSTMSANGMVGGDVPGGLVGRMGSPQNIDGGALRTFSVDAHVRCVKVHLRSDGGPVNALVEVWQGPNNVQQVAEVYADDGLDKPFSTVIQTPGYGTTIAVRNVGPMTFPITAQIESFGGPGPHESPVALVGGVEPPRPIPRRRLATSVGGSKSLAFQGSQRGWGPGRQPSYYHHEGFNHGGWQAGGGGYGYGSVGPGGRYGDYSYFNSRIVPQRPPPASVAEEAAEEHAVAAMEEEEDRIKYDAALDYNI